MPTLLRQGERMILLAALTVLRLRARRLLDATEGVRSGTGYRLGLLEEAGLHTHKIFWGQTPATTEEAASVAAE